MDYDNEITKLNARITKLESYLEQFESFKSYKLPINGKAITTKPVQKNRTKGSRLREDWLPSPDLVEWAAKDFPAVDLKLETDKFIDYWLSRADKGAIKLSWDRTYRNWIRQAASSYRGKRETHQRSNESAYTSSIRKAFED